MNKTRTRITERTLPHVPRMNHVGVRFLTRSLTIDRSVARRETAFVAETNLVFPPAGIEVSFNGVVWASRACGARICCTPGGLTLSHFV